MTASSNLSNSDPMPAGDSVAPDLVIPLIAEELEIGKRLVESGMVRVTKTVGQRAEVVRELLMSEHVEVERVPLDEIIATPPPVRVEGDVTIIPIVEEILVVTKQLRLKEELRVIRKQVVTEHHQEVTLRREELVVERFNDSEPV
jgi:uncharacterized protein (TIGR02271 family)